MTPALSLRTRLFLIVLLGAVLPLAIVGVWLARSAGRSGEALLRDRLAQSLRRVATDIGDRWVAQRSWKWMRITWPNTGWTSRSGHIAT